MKIAAAWRWALNWIERGDLIPFLLIVSVTHYIRVLLAYDDPISALSVGVLVDLGHFRTIRYASRCKTEGRERIIRWVIAVIMTLISLRYHVQFYGDIVLALPIPFLIGVLAWLPEPKQDKPKDTKPPEGVTTQEPITEHAATVAELVTQLLEQNQEARNEWNSEQIAEAVGCSGSYIRRNWHKNGNGWEKR